MHVIETLGKNAERRAKRQKEEFVKYRESKLTLLLKGTRTSNTFRTGQIKPWGVRHDPCDLNYLVFIKRPPTRWASATHAVLAEMGFEFLIRMHPRDPRRLPPNPLTLASVNTATCVYVCGWGHRLAGRQLAHGHDCRPASRCRRHRRDALHAALRRQRQTHSESRPRQPRRPAPRHSQADVGYILSPFSPLGCLTCLILLLLPRVIRKLDAG